MIIEHRNDFALALNNSKLALSIIYDEYILCETQLHL